MASSAQHGLLVELASCLHGLRVGDLAAEHHQLRPAGAVLSATAAPSPLAAVCAPAPPPRGRLLHPRAPVQEPPAPPRQAKDAAAAERGRENSGGHHDAHKEDEPLPLLSSDGSASRAVCFQRPPAEVPVAGEQRRIVETGADGRRNPTFQVVVGDVQVAQSRNTIESLRDGAGEVVP